MKFKQATKRDWICGIYKISKYQDEFYAYYLPDGYKNWGERAGKPPQESKHVPRNMVWPTFESAVQACEEHAKTHKPKPTTVRLAHQLAGKYGIIVKKDVGPGKSVSVTAAVVKLSIPGKEDINLDGSLVRSNEIKIVRNEK